MHVLELINILIEMSDRMHGDPEVVVILDDKIIEIKGIYNTDSKYIKISIE